MSSISSYIVDWLKHLYSRYRIICLRWWWSSGVFVLWYGKGNCFFTRLLVVLATATWDVACAHVQFWSLKQRFKSLKKIQFLLTGQACAQIRIPTKAFCFPRQLFWRHHLTHDLGWICCWLDVFVHRNCTVVWLHLDGCVHFRGVFAVQKKCRIQLRKDSFCLFLRLNSNLGSLDIIMCNLQRISRRLWRDRFRSLTQTYGDCTMEPKVLLLKTWFSQGLRTLCLKSCVENLIFWIMCVLQVCSQPHWPSVGMTSVVFSWHSSSASSPLWSCSTLC